MSLRARSLPQATQKVGTMFRFFSQPQKPNASKADTGLQGESNLAVSRPSGRASDCTVWI